MKISRSKSQDNSKFKIEVGEVINSVRPTLQADGGDIELVDANDGTVKVRLQGACRGCPMANHTLELGVERLLKERVKGFKRLEAV